MSLVVASGTGDCKPWISRPASPVHTTTGLSLCLETPVGASMCLWSSGASAIGFDIGSYDKYAFFELPHLGGRNTDHEAQNRAS